MGPRDVFTNLDKSNRAQTAPAVKSANAARNNQGSVVYGPSTYKNTSTSSKTATSSSTTTKTRSKAEIESAWQKQKEKAASDAVDRHSKAGKTPTQINREDAQTIKNKQKYGRSKAEIESAWQGQKEKAAKDAVERHNKARQTTGNGGHQEPTYDYGGGGGRKPTKTSASVGVAAATGTAAITTVSGKNIAAGTAIGLNADKISAIIAALDAYINDAIKNIKIGVTVKDIQLAIKGSAAQKECERYIKTIDAACEKYFKDLKRYKDKLNEIKATYVKNDNFNGMSSGTGKISGTTINAGTATATQTGATAQNPSTVPSLDDVIKSYSNTSTTGTINSDNITNITGTIRRSNSV